MGVFMRYDCTGGLSAYSHLQLEKIIDLIFSFQSDICLSFQTRSPGLKPLRSAGGGRMMGVWRSLFAWVPLTRRAVRVCELQ